MKLIRSFFLPFALLVLDWPLLVQMTFTNQKKNELGVESVLTVSDHSLKVEDYWTYRIWRLVL